MSDMSNGMPLRVIRRVEKTVWCIPVTHFSEDVNRRKRVKDESRSRQIDEMCSEIVEELNSSKFTTNYFLYNGTFWCRVWCFLVFGAPALSVLPLLIFLLFVRYITEDILGGVSVTLVTVPIAAVSILVCCYYRKNVPKRETLLYNVTWKYLRDNYKTLKVLPLLRSTDEVVILNYDTDPCKKFCTVALKRRIDDENEIQRIADSIILNFIYRRQTSLANWYILEDFKYDRHNTFYQKKCICQYLEPSLLSDSFFED